MLNMNTVEITKPLVLFWHDPISWVTKRSLHLTTLSMFGDNRQKFDVYRMLNVQRLSLTEKPNIVPLADKFHVYLLRRDLLKNLNYIMLYVRQEL